MCEPDLPEKETTPKKRTKPKPHYTLEELLARCDLSLPRSAEETAWLEAPPVGRELEA